MKLYGHIRSWAAGLGMAALFGASAALVCAEPPLERQDLREPVYRVSKVSPPVQQTAAAAEHPLDPVLELAEQVHRHVQQNVRDYTCILVKRELVGDTLMDYEFMQAKIRNQQVQNGQVVEPFSVYLKFLKPDSVKGREVIYVAGENNGKLRAHEGGFRGRLMPSVWLNPSSGLAMRGNRYPITEIGIETLCRRLIEKGQRDRQLGQCDVRIVNDTRVGDRPCKCIEVVHHEALPQLDFHRARVFLDDELQIPIRYEAYGWPARPGGNPPLIEEYSYMNVKLNVGLTDADFDSESSSYNF